MSRFSKAMKKYERQILLGLVILLLVSFSVLGAVQCGMPQGGQTQDYSGTFQATPTEKLTVGHGEFVEVANRYRPYLWSTGSPSLRYGPLLGRLSAGRPRDAVAAATWAHLLGSKMAEEAGYRAGEGDQLRLGIRQAIAPRMQNLAFSDALYDTFLREHYRQPAPDFEKTVGEVVEKDLFFEPLVDSLRYAIPYEQAYEDWKKRTEYVDLQYVALRARDFALPARRIENTRTAIQEQLDRLRALDRTARAIARVEQRIARYRGDHEGALPESLAALELTPGALEDAWGRPLGYAVEGDDYRLVSHGWDGEPGGGDDLDRTVAAEVASLEALRRVGDALEIWHDKTGTWPESLDRLREPPVEGTLAPLAREEKDGHDRPLVYTPPAEEGAAPTLLAAGADGEPGTSDDVAASFEEGRVVVGLGPLTSVALDRDLVDAWEKPLRVRLADATTRTWEVLGAGPDGTFGTDDDLETGNAPALRAFYDRPLVRSDYLLPTRRSFRAIYVQLPLVPDGDFARLWEAFPEYRPDEKEAYRRWLMHYSSEPMSYYRADTDPANPETGHGAALARRLAPGKPATLVPDATIFGEPPEDLAVGPDDPDLSTYLDQGWRPILLREEFFENLLADQLRRARESREAYRAWEAAKAAEEAGEGEDPGEAPERVTFESLLAGVLAPFLPGEADPPYLGFYETEKPLTLSEIEAIPSIGGQALTSIGFQGLSEDGQFASIPTQLNDALTKAILQNVELRAQRQPELEEVRDEVYERYLESRALDLAADALRELRESVKSVERSDPAVWEEKLQAWREGLDAEPTVDSTGWFIGPRPPRDRQVPEGMPDDEALALRRRDFVRQTGYEAVRPTEGATSAGALSRDVLQDESLEGTDTAYLVRVLDRKEPPAEAFSPADYRRYVMFELLRDLFEQQRGGERRQGEPTSPYLAALYRYYLDAQALGNVVHLETNAPIEPDAP